MRRFWLILLTIVLAAFSIWMFLALYEQYDDVIDAGYSKEAKLNPYLAAKHFLEKNNMKVHEQTVALDFSTIPTNDTVFLSEVDSMLLSESHIEKAMAWVKQGGILILGVSKEVEGHDSFLTRFDIKPERVKQHDQHDEDDTNEWAETLIEAMDLAEEPEQYTVKLSDNKDQIRVQVLDRIVLNHPDLSIESDEYAGSADGLYKLTASVSDEHGPRLLQFDYGDGGFTVLSSTKFWQNKYIGKADHAYLLAYLMPKESTVHLFYDITAPSLLSLLEHYFYEWLIASIALLALWLWRVCLRVQGERSVVDGQRRIFAEHLTASAEFLAAKQQYQSLVTPIKEDITSQMQLIHPRFTQLDSNTQVALIAQRSALPQETIQTWFAYTNTVNNQDELIEALKIGNAIRRKL